MTDRTRPLLLGYIREDCLAEHRFSASPHHDPLTTAQHSLAAYAHTEGFTLGTVYVEHPHTAPSAIHALAEHIHHQEDAWAVVIPEPEHLTEHDHHTLNNHAHGYATISVLVANHTPHRPADLAPVMPLSAPGPPTTPESGPARRPQRATYLRPWSDLVHRSKAAVLTQSALAARGGPWG